MGQRSAAPGGTAQGAPSRVHKRGAFEGAGERERHNTYRGGAHDESVLRRLALGAAHSRSVAIARLRHLLCLLRRRCCLLVELPLRPAAVHGMEVVCCQGSVHGALAVRLNTFPPQNRLGVSTPANGGVKHVLHLRLGQPLRQRRVSGARQRLQRVSNGLHLVVHVLQGDVDAPALLRPLGAHAQERVQQPHRGHRGGAGRRRRSRCHHDALKRALRGLRALCPRAVKTVDSTAARQ